MPKNKRTLLKRLIDRGFTLPGYNYLGPFNAQENGEPTNPSDRAAQQHDQGYSMLRKRLNPYTTYNDADADADAAWGYDYGGRIAKRVFRKKEDLAEKGWINTQRGKHSSLRGSDRQSVRDAYQHRKRKIESLDAFKSKRLKSSLLNLPSTPQVAASTNMADGGGGEGSGHDGNLKETPIDDVWNVTRGPPNYTFATLPFVYWRNRYVNNLGTDLVFRMTSPYDPQHATSTIDTNAGTGVQGEEVATNTDTSITPARWYNFYATQYKYYHVVSCRWRVMIENLTMEPLWVHIMYRNDDAPPQSATNEDIMFWAGTKSHFLGPMGYAVATSGTAETWHVNNNSNIDEDQDLSTNPNYESGNMMPGGKTNIMKDSGEYRPGQYDREIRLDNQVENWTQNNTNPALPERLFIRVKPDNNSVDSNSATGNTTRTLQFRAKVELEYLTEFKELATGLRYPVQRQPAVVTISQNVDLGLTSEPVVVAP